ncbi:hypothetical protein BaRGS_00011832 [Batillaria attramentaria]|uniref:Uncharacterized protein n=1 Tax=Batillaria attramentaria TaxID=370345 RepID=A0ABD0LBT1_9CAEN
MPDGQQSTFLLDKFRKMRCWHSSGGNPLLECLQIWKIIVLCKHLFSAVPLVTSNPQNAEEQSCSSFLKELFGFQNDYCLARAYPALALSSNDGRLCWHGR